MRIVSVEFIAYGFVMILEEDPFVRSIFAGG